MGNNIVFYGERGFVNALVLDLYKDLNLIKDFLLSIHFCDGIPSWIQKVENVTFFIEPSFAESGDPDLLILCKCGDEKHLVFLEAKVEPYDTSAIDINDLMECIESYKKAYDSRKNLKTIGINSRVNTQLTLKYRLSRLLMARKNGSQLKEGKLWEIYSNNNLDSINHPRQLKKGLNIKLCDDHFKDITDCWFVALTSDSLPIVPYDNKSTRPFIYDENGFDIWDNLKDHFGIITYADLDKILMLGLNYNQAKEYFDVKSMLPNIEESVDFSIRPENWKNFNFSIKDNLCEDIVDRIKQTIRELSVEEDDNKYSYYNLEKNNGSQSFKIGPQTVISLFPYGINGTEGVMLALRLEHFDQSYKSHFSIGPFMFGAVNKRQFMGCFIQQAMSKYYEEELLNIIKEYWKNCF